MNGRVLLWAPVLLPLAAAALFTQGVQKPDENRFTPVTLVPAGILDEPMVFEVLDDGTVYIAERKGRLMRYDPVSSTTTRVDSIAINHTYVNAAGQPREAEEGLVGFTLDPDFERNHWAYFLYAHPTVAKHTLSRMELRGDSLLKDTETVILEFDTQRETCCHTGGGMTWDEQGNLYITTGNNTGNVRSSQTDQRPGRMNWDDQRGAANTNDLRGKILRIRPEPDGSYTIPAGNLFPPGTPGTRPEIFTMGHRNPWRVSVDSRTGFVYWGEVGPDSDEDGPNTVTGEDELNQARGPGFFGWPYFVGNNRAFPITDYTTCEGFGNQATGCVILPPKNPAQPINDSRWNNGLRELPPAEPAFVSYPSGLSERFPEVGTGSRCATGGPIYHRSDLENPERPWPAYFEGKWIATDCVRGYFVSISMAPNGDFQSMERVLEHYRPVEPMDLKFGPEGDLYVLEYGSIWFGKSPDSRLVRIEYNAGNRAPEVEVTSDTRGGAVPFEVTLSAEGTEDPDGDALRYEWRVVPQTGGEARTFSTANPTASFDRAGVYTATLTVTDAAGASASESLRIVAGNRPPMVAVDLPGGNRSFFTPGEPIQYAVRVSDAEDGAVSPADVAVSLEYVPEGFDLAGVEQGDRPADAATRFAVAQALIAGSDCRACHTAAPPRSVGPSFSEIATRYQGNAAAHAQLVQSIRAGSAGRWGEVAMPAHPAMSVAEAAIMSRYILNSTSTVIGGTPLAGSFTPEIPEGDNGRGSVVIRAVYTDRGAGTLPAQTVEEMLVLRSPLVGAGSADVVSNALVVAQRRGTGPLNAQPRANGYLGFEAIDLSGVRALEVSATAPQADNFPGGTVEVRLGSPTGQLVGQAEVRPTPPQPQAAGGGGGGGGGNDTPPPGVPIPLSPVTGVRDLYLVFRNPAAPAALPLMSVTAIRFVR